MSSRYDLIKHQVADCTEQVEQWKVEHDEAMTAWTLNHFFEICSLCFRSVLRLEAEASEEERNASSIRQEALELMVKTFSQLRDRCREVPVDQYEYEVSPEKIQHMINAVAAMLKGVLVWDPTDAASAERAMSEGEVIGLDELRGELQGPHP